MPERHHITDILIERILENSNGKEFRDLRDRASYVFVTGTHPSHLRRQGTQILTRISRLSNTATALDRRHGNLRLDDRIATKLNLEAHPMVTKVREYLAKGYVITVSLGSNERKPYTKIFLSRGSGPEEDRITVQIDGSVLDHWPKR